MSTDAGVSAILHTKIGVGEVGNKVQAIAWNLVFLPYKASHQPVQRGKF